MLKRLAEKHPSAIAPLTYQYRMNEEICKLSSYLVYGGRLKCGSNVIRDQRLSLPSFPEGLPSPASTKGIWPWLRMTISPEKPVIFVDTDNMRKNPAKEQDKGSMEALEEKMGGRAGGKVTNPVEAALVRYIVQGLIATGASPSQIGVISPFRAQVSSNGGYFFGFDPVRCILTFFF